MLKRIFPLFAIVMLIGLTGCGDAKDDKTDADKTAMTFNVTGMTCEGCVNSITAKLDGLESVDRCVVVLDDAEQKRGHAELVAAASAEQEIIAAITELGFEAERAPDATDSATDEGAEAGS